MDEFICPKCEAKVPRRAASVGCCESCGRMLPEEIVSEARGEKSRRDPVFISYPGQARRVFVCLLGGVVGMAIALGGGRYEHGFGVEGSPAWLGFSMTATAVASLWAMLTRGWPFKLGDDFMAQARQFLLYALVLHLGGAIAFLPPDWVIRGTSIQAAWFGYVVTAGCAIAMCWVLLRWFTRGTVDRSKGGSRE
jgi:hypothetical protein